MNPQLFLLRPRLLPALVCLLVAAVAGAQDREVCETTPEASSRPTGPTLEDSPLGLESYARWRDALLPAPEEETWLQIPWLSTFGDGIRESARQDKPLLLWGMNGHPLGCT